MKSASKYMGGATSFAVNSSVLRWLLKAGHSLIALLCALSCFALPSLTFPVAAADFPQAKQADWIAKDFRFHTGEVMPELRLHYVTVGTPSGEPVLILHGTSGSGAARCASTRLSACRHFDEGSQEFKVACPWLTGEWANVVPMTA